MSSTPSIATLSQRLTSLSSLILERSRVISLNLPASASTDSQIVRGLTIVRDGLARLEDEIEIEKSGLSLGGKGGKSAGGRKAGGQGLEEGALKGIGERYDRLIGMMEEDQIGWQKVQSLKRVPKESPRAPSPPPASSPFTSSSDTDPLSNAAPQFTIDSPSTSPTPSGSTTPTIKPFRDADPSNPFNDSSSGPSDPLQMGGAGRYRDGGDAEAQYGEAEGGEELSEQQMMENQRLMMDEQDNRLSLLSNSISRQHLLGTQINSELEVHHELLEDTSEALDRTGLRLGGARKRLEKVARKSREYGSTITIVVLVLILLILIIAFKT